MTTASVSPTSPSPAGLVVDPDALADVCVSLLRTGALLEDAAVHRPDTGVTAVATGTALRILGARVAHAGGDMRSLGRRLAAFADLVADVDDRTRSDIDRIRGDARW